MKPGTLRAMGSQRVGHDLVTKQQQQHIHTLSFLKKIPKLLLWLIKEITYTINCCFLEHSVYFSSIYLRSVQCSLMSYVQTLGRTQGGNVKVTWFLRYKIHQTVHACEDCSLTWKLPSWVQSTPTLEFLLFPGDWGLGKELTHPWGPGPSQWFILLVQFY